MGLPPKSYVLQHGWLPNVKPNVKPNVMANNKLKYWRVDAKRRDELRREWNSSVNWPLWLGAAALFGWWMRRMLRQREEMRCCFGVAVSLWFIAHPDCAGYYLPDFKDLSRCRSLDE